MTSEPKVRIDYRINSGDWKEYQEPNTEHYARETLNLARQRPWRSTGGIEYRAVRVICTEEVLDW